MEDLLICRSVPQSTAMCRTVEFNVLPSNCELEQFLSLWRREGWLSERAPHLAFVALDGGQCESVGWTYQRARNYSRCLCGFKDHTLVAAMGLVLKATWSLKGVCSTATVSISPLRAVWRILQVAFCSMYRQWFSFFCSFLKICFCTYPPS